MLCGDGVTDMPGTADDVFHPYDNFSPPVPLHQRESREENRTGRLLISYFYRVTVSCTARIEVKGYGLLSWREMGG
jgi:hypothetical protein